MTEMDVLKKMMETRPPYQWAWISLEQQVAIKWAVKRIKELEYYIKKGGAVAVGKTVFYRSVPVAPTKWIQEFGGF